MTVEKLNILPQGNYVLAQPWVCRPSDWWWTYRQNDINQLQQIVQVDRIANTVVFPAGLTLTLTYHTNKWVKLSIFRKYNLGTGIPKFVYEFRLGVKPLGEMPVLEVT